MSQYDAAYVPPIDAPPPRRWPLAGIFWIDLVIAFVLILISQVVIVLVVGLAATNGDLLAIERLFSNADALASSLGTGAIFAILLTQNLILVALPILRVRVLRGEPLATLGFQAGHPLQLILIGVGLGIAVLISNAVLSSVFISLGIRQNQSEQYPLFRGDTLGQALFAVGAAVLAPVGEEVFFRGYAFAAFQRWSVPAAYIISAALFMFAHSLSATEGLIGLLIPAFVMGLLLAGARHMTRSLLPGIIAHGINNGLALTALLFCINNPGTSFCPAL